MLEKSPKNDQREDTKTPSNESGLQILPISHVEFESRWSLSKDALNAGIRAAAQEQGQSQLVLRAYSLSAESSSSDYSNVWRDYNINSTENSAYFTLPKPTPKIKTAIGLINRSGRFSPLVCSKAVELPPPPDVLSAQPRVMPKTGNLIKTKKPISNNRADDTNKPTTPWSEAEFAEPIEPCPPIAQFGYRSPPSHACSHRPENQNSDNGSSLKLFNQLEEIWTGSTPIEIRAEFVVTGKIAPGMRVLLGNQILEPNSEGFIEWKRRLDSFAQIWPLLQEAMTSPSVAANPSLDFFKDSKPSEKILELHAALKIAGKVNDPEYHSMIPEGLDLDANGIFKLSRVLPDGAVILPGLSVIAKS